MESQRNFSANEGYILKFISQKLLVSHEWYFFSSIKLCETPWLYELSTSNTLSDLSHYIGGGAGIVSVVLPLQAVPGYGGGEAAGGEGRDGGGQTVATLSVEPVDSRGRLAWQSRPGYYSLF